jgi:prephenate dehydrogenase
MSRLAAGNPELYAAIVSTNRDPILRSLTAVEASLAKLRRHVEAGDPRLAELLEDAKLARDIWEREADRAGDG